MIICSARMIDVTAAMLGVAPLAQCSSHWRRASAIGSKDSGRDTLDRRLLARRRIAYGSSPARRVIGRPRPQQVRETSHTVNGSEPRSLRCAA
jgi:hypothetical protein